MAEKYLIHVGDEDVTLEMRREADGTYLRRENADEWKRASLERVGDSGLYLLMVDNRPTELYLQRRRGGAIVTIGRHQFNMDVGPWRPISQRKKASTQQSGDHRLISPMTGSIVEVRCRPGDRVAQGDVLLVMESMKMNNELKSPADGIIDTVAVTPGQKINANQLLVALHTEDAEEEATSDADSKSS